MAFPNRRQTGILIMSISRRQVLAGSALSCGIFGGLALSRLMTPCGRLATPSAALASDCNARIPQAFSITPVVRDGKWNWKEQPLDQQGYVDPREFDISIGLRWTSQGRARNLRGTTPVPVILPGQEITDVRIEKSEGCAAEVVALSESAAQLQVQAPAIERGQTIAAAVILRARLFRFCPRYSKDQFQAAPTYPDAIMDQATGNSPGIRSDLTALQMLVDSLASQHEHPWSKCRKFFEWVRASIAGRPGAYTSVQAALKTRVGDCEERAGVFVALCRCAGIPARLVLVPNHCWAEFCLIDNEGVPRWIPAHTAAYDWFGWTGTHELVLQKGDRIWQLGSNKTVRLVTDWHSFEGRKPTIEYLGQLQPVSGPGKRIKNRQAGWNLMRTHPDDRFLRA
jgi:hypothetical protein